MVFFCVEILSSILCRFLLYNIKDFFVRVTRVVLNQHGVCIQYFPWYLQKLYMQGYNNVFIIELNVKKKTFK